MRVYCTIFDSNYLYQGVALYNSLRRHAGNFVLYALCMDATSHATMAKLKLPGVVPLNVEELVTPEVSVVRCRTTHGQFCWVCQPLVIEFLLDRYGHDMVTYLEADSLFYADPEILFQELGDDSVSLVPHNYSPDFDQTERSGRFCVQFNAFRNNTEGRTVLEFWKESCYQYDKAKPLVFPGQTCLDSLPERFPGVKIIEHIGAGVAPWNVEHLGLEVLDSGLYVRGVSVVFYHYHQYGRYKNGNHELGHYPLSKKVVDAIYRPYVKELAAVRESVRSVDASFDYQRTYEDSKTLLDLIRSPRWQNTLEYYRLQKRKMRGLHNNIPDRYFFGNR